jgi:hypothetical protein
MFFNLRVKKNMDVNENERLFNFTLDTNLINGIALLQSS